MAGRGWQDQSLSPRSVKYESSIDDALRTMEHLALWLETAKEENIWLQVEDPIQAVMLHGMLVHLREEIDDFIAVGGDELQETVRALRALADQRA